MPEFEVTKPREGAYSIEMKGGHPLTIWDVDSGMPTTADIFDSISEKSRLEKGLKEVPSQYLENRYADGLLVLATNGERRVVGTQSNLPLVNHVKVQRMFGEYLNKNILRTPANSLLFSPNFQITETATALIYPEYRDRGYGTAMKLAMNARLNEKNEGMNILTVGTTWKNSSIKANQRSGMVVADPNALPLLTNYVWFMPFINSVGEGENEVFRKYGQKDPYITRSWVDKLPYTDDKLADGDSAVLLVSNMESALKVEAELQAMMEPFSSNEMDDITAAISADLRREAGEKLQTWKRIKQNLTELEVPEGTISMVLHLIGIVRKFNEVMDDHYTTQEMGRAKRNGNHNPKAS